MEDILLSICISSYDRGIKCYQLVKRLLSVDDERFNIFICDDHSSNETITKLKILTSPKVKLIFNQKNMGPCRNWFKTIDSGNGKYILHVLDRDDIEVRYLKTILDILEKNSVGAGYFGKSTAVPIDGIEKKISFAICKKGREAFLTLGGIPIHPTGFFVERTIWNQINFKKFFYNNKKYGIYPHSYVIALISTQRDILYSPISFYYHIYKENNNKSRFYSHQNTNYWWLPNNVIKTYNCLTLYLAKFADDSYKKEFVCKRFCYGLKRATFTYQNTVANQQEMERYGLDIDYIYSWKLLLISLKYRLIFEQILKQLKLKERDVLKEINHIWFTNLKEILEEF